MKNGLLTTLVVALLFAANSTAFASPKSSAPFDKALRDAEMIAGLSPQWSVYHTLGESMGEFFGSDSLIIVQETEASLIATGMMVLYRAKSGELIAHKVIDRIGDSLITKGDSNFSKDPDPVTPDMVLGTVFCVFHTAGAPEDTAMASNGSPLPTALCKKF